MGSLGVGSLVFATTESLGAACSVAFDAVSRIGELFDDTTTGGAVVEGEVGVERLGPQPMANEKKTRVAIRAGRLGMGIIFPNRKKGWGKSVIGERRLGYHNPKRKRGTISQVPHLRIGL